MYFYRLHHWFAFRFYCGAIPVMNIAKAHTDRRCKFCRTPLFIGAAFWSLCNNKYICERCNNLAVAYIIIKLVVTCENVTH